MTLFLKVEGNSRDVHSIIRDDVYRIGYEAIRNACTHAGGSRLDVELSYRRDLILRVRDNGRGIDPKVLANGKDVLNQDERAERGARLNLQSRARTEIEHRSGRLAFRQRQHALPSSLQSWLFRLNLMCWHSFTQPRG